jgi:hypothetical protein
MKTLDTRLPYPLDYHLQSRAKQLKKAIIGIFARGCWFIEAGIWRKQEQGFGVILQGCRQKFFSGSGASRLEPTWVQISVYSLYCLDANTFIAGTVSCILSLPSPYIMRLPANTSPRLELLNIGSRVLVGNPRCVRSITTGRVDGYTAI